MFLRFIKAQNGKTMKLAQALITRANYNMRINELRNRMRLNARVQEGETPAEDVRALLAEVDQLSTELEDLIRKINRTNNETEFESGVSLADALATRDVLRLRQNIYREIAEAGANNQQRYYSQIKFTRAVDVAAIHRTADQIAVEYRELDTRIQELNWNTDLIE